MNFYYLCHQPILAYVMNSRYPLINKKLCITITCLHRALQLFTMLFTFLHQFFTTFLARCQYQIGALKGSSHFSLVKPHPCVAQLPWIELEHHLPVGYPGVVANSLFPLPLSSQCQMIGLICSLKYTIFSTTPWTVTSTITRQVKTLILLKC